MFAPVFPLLLAAAAPAPATPPPAAPVLAAGDTWTYERDIRRGPTAFASQRLVLRVERVGEGDMLVGVKPEGSPNEFEDHMVGLDWSQHRILDGRTVTIGRPFDFPLTPGKTWTIDYVDPTHHGLQVSTTHHETYKVVGWEDVTTPAGVFHTMRIDSEDRIKAEFAGGAGLAANGVTSADGSTVVAHTDRSGPHTAYAQSLSSFFYAPAVRYWVKTLQEVFNAEGVRTERKTDVLVSYAVGGGDHPAPR